MEGLYSDLKKRVQSQPPDEPGITTFLAKIEAKQNWFKKAEVRVDKRTIPFPILFFSEHMPIALLYWGWGLRFPDQASAAGILKGNSEKPKRSIKGKGKGKASAAP